MQFLNLNLLCIALKNYTKQITNAFMQMGSISTRPINVFQIGTMDIEASIEITNEDNEPNIGNLLKEKFIFMINKKIISYQS